MTLLLDAIGAQRAVLVGHDWGAGISTRLASHSDFAYVDTLMRRWAPNWSGPEREETLAGVKAAIADPRVLDGALSYYRHARPGGLGRISQPTLIVGGTTDIVQPEAFRRSAAHVDGPSDVVIVEGAGHWPHRENAPLFNERLLAFLAEVSEAGSR